jgi:hypothetical protein
VKRNNVRIIALIRRIKGIREMLDRIEGGLRNGLFHKRFHLRKILVGADLQFRGGRPLFNLLGRRLCLIESAQTRDHPIDLPFPDRFWFRWIFSECAKEGARYASVFATRVGADLLLINVTHPPNHTAADPTIVPPDCSYSSSGMKPLGVTRELRSVCSSKSLLE